MSDIERIDFEKDLEQDYDYLMEVFPTLETLIVTAPPTAWSMWASISHKFLKKKGYTEEEFINLCQMVHADSGSNSGDKNSESTLTYEDFEEQTR